MKHIIIIILIASVTIHADTLTTKSGKVYENFEISKVTERGISIFHESGGATIPFADLPDDIRKKYASEEQAILNKVKIEKQKAYEKKLLEQISIPNIDIQCYYIKIADYGKGVIAIEFFPESTETRSLNPDGYTNGVANAYLTRYEKTIPKRYGKKIFLSGFKNANIGKGEQVNLSDYNQGIFWRIGTKTINGVNYPCYTVNRHEALQFITLSRDNSKQNNIDKGKKTK